MQTLLHAHRFAGANRRASALPPFLAPAAAMAFLTLGLGPNAALAAGALVALLLGCALLWRPGEAPILLYVFAIQWLEASISVFHANLLGIHVDDIGLRGADIELATILSLLGLLALAAGMRIAAGPPRRADTALARHQAEAIPQRRWLLLYIAVFAVATAAQALALAMPGLSQPLLAVAKLKWAAFVMLTFVSFARPDASRALWLAVFLSELALSLGGYFSSFKLVFLFALLGITGASARLPLRRAAGLGALAAAAAMLAVVWTAIKTDYRAHVSGGAAAQIVAVGRAERLAKLVELAGALDGDRLRHGLDQLVRRIGYVQYFGAATTFVPAVVPHRHGALWLDAVTRPLMPRLLFPDKGVIDESALTRRYTGIPVAGFERGTQISVGYMGESYIDFGRSGMMAALFALGLALGGIHRWLVRGRHSRGILGMGLASAILMSAGTIGISSAKLVGALAVSVLVAWLLTRIAVPRLSPWLRA